jgi:hypothetical protein
MKYHFKTALDILTMNKKLSKSAREVLIKYNKIIDNVK